MTAPHAPTRPSIPPVVWLAAGLWMGIVGAEEYFAAGLGHGGDAVAVLRAGVAAVLVLAGVWLRWRRGACLVLVVGLMTGACLGTLYLETWRQTVERLGSAGVVETRCTAIADPRQGMWGTSVRVRPDERAFEGFDATLLLGDEALELGRVATARGVVQVPDTASDRGRRAWRAGEVGSLRPWGLQENGWRDGPLGSACRIRHVVGERLSTEAATGPRLMSGVLLGDKRRLRGTPVETDFRVAGLSHLLAVSGLHLGLVSVGVGWLLRALRAPRGLQATGVLVAALGFLVLTGVQVSTVRALCMVVLAWLASIAGRRSDALGALAATVCLVLAHRPMVAFDVSLQLSASAVGGLLVFGDLVGHWIETAVGFRVLTRAIAATVVAQVATWPVIAGTFHTVSLVAPLANAAAIPLASVGLGCGVASLVSPVHMLGESLMAAGTKALGACGAVARALAAVPGAAVCTATPAVPSVAAWLLVGAGLWAAWPLPRRRGQAVVAAISGVALTVAVAVGMPSGPRRLVVLDVGQADALLLQDGRQSMLVDCGAYPQDVQAALGRYGVRSLDVVVLTHAHDDHIGGIEGLVGVVSAGWVGVPDCAEPEAFDGARSTATRLTPRGAVEWKALSAGDSWSVGETSVSVVWPRGPDPAAGTNDTSVILRLERNGFVAVLGADAEEGAWRRLAERGALDDVDVLKVSHHGSHNGVEPLALGLLKPELALVSVGQDNRFGHPSPDALAMLRDAGCRVWRTDLAGDLEVSLDDSPTCLPAAVR